MKHHNKNNKTEPKESTRKNRKMSQDERRHLGNEKHHKR